MEKRSEWLTYPQLLERLNQSSPEKLTSVDLMFAPNTIPLYTWRITAFNIMNMPEDVERVVTVVEKISDINRDLLIFQYVTKL